MTIADIKPDVIRSWPKFVEFVTQFEGDRWHFRGCLEDHPLESSLERAVLKYWGFPLSKAPEIEKRMLRDFKRAFPSRAEVDPPRREADLDWLALMQHYGAPTRLLDWTYSPFIAAFFALELLLKRPQTPPEPDKSAVVWAISNAPTGNEAIKSLIPEGDLRDSFERHSQGRQGSDFRAVFREAKPPLCFVTPVNPYNLNERLVVQQGLFLCPGDISSSFVDNLEAVPGATDPSNLKKIVLPRTVLAEAFRGLRRMNISAASLFPGIDGYARSQHHSIDFLLSVPLFEGTEE